MAQEFSYDDTRLRRMIDSLGAKERRKALSGGLRRIGKIVRDEAVKELRSSGLSSNKDVEKGIRVVVYRRNVIGFKVTVGTKKRRVNYSGLDATQRKAKAYKEKLRIVPLWAEGGTRERRTTRSGRLLGFSWKAKGKGRRTGSMPAFRFMDKAKDGALNKAANSFEREMVGYITKTALKYGGTF